MWPVAGERYCVRLAEVSVSWLLFLVVCTMRERLQINCRICRERNRLRSCWRVGIWVWRSVILWKHWNYRHNKGLPVFPILSLYTPCLKKTVQIYFCQNFVKFRPIVKTLVTKIAEKTSFSVVYLFSTSPNLMSTHCRVKCRCSKLLHNSNHVSALNVLTT